MPAEPSRGGVVAESLRQIPVFRELSAQHLRDIAQLARRRIYRPGQVVVCQGDEGDGVFWIQLGFLKASVSGTNGSLSTLNMMGPGEIFGELSLIDGGPRSATVSAITRAELVFVGREQFLALLESRPRVAIGVMGVLAARLRRASERSDDLAGKRVGSRLAKQLMLLAENHGIRLGPRRMRLGMKLSQRELGALVGATRESVNKHLGMWREEGIVTEENGYLVVLDADMLRALAAH